MRKYNIVCPIRRKKYKYKVTKEHKVCKNYLQREFKQNVPGKVNVDRYILFTVW